ncbi:MAG: hypothetical protein PHY14_04515 [Candidatus Gracilibacteria bacterium]|nr:hypothetical protein [Candidatus Gracilibacteria bacterium]
MADKTTKSVQTGKKPQKDSSTQRYLPFSEIRDNLIMMKDGSSRMALRVHAMNFNLKSTEEQDAILISYQRFLNSLNFPIQIVVRSLKVDIEAYINRLKNLALKQQNTLLQEQTYKYIDFLMNLVDLAQIMKKEFYIIIPFDFESNESVRKTDMFGIFRSFWSALSQEESIADIRSNRIRLEKLKKGNFERLSTAKMSLEAIGLKAEPLNKEELIKLIYNYYNPRLRTENNLKADTENLNFG